MSDSATWLTIPWLFSADDKVQLTDAFDQAQVTWDSESVTEHVNTVRFVVCRYLIAFPKAEKKRAFKILVKFLELENPKNLVPREGPCPGCDVLLDQAWQCPSCELNFGQPTNDPLTTFLVEHDAFRYA